MDPAPDLPIRIRIGTQQKKFDPNLTKRTRNTEKLLNFSRRFSSPSTEGWTRSFWSGTPCATCCRGVPRPGSSRQASPSSLLVARVLSRVVASWALLFGQASSSSTSPSWRSGTWGFRDTTWISSWYYTNGLGTTRISSSYSDFHVVSRTNAVYCIVSRFLYYVYFLF